ncbi:MAG: hypothetical protein IM647_07630, partial [Phenylobacterium sp.]|nr:hypothetical protein [Phenylobacterium sp.]
MDWGPHGLAAGPGPGYALSMPVLKSALDPASTAFRAHAEVNRALAAQLR